jgi:hypothetical protein
MSEVCYDAGRAVDVAAEVSSGLCGASRYATRLILLAFLEHMSQNYVGDMETEHASGYLAQMVAGS